MGVGVETGQEHRRVLLRSLLRGSPRLTAEALLSNAWTFHRQSVSTVELAVADCRVTSGPEHLTVAVVWETNTEKKTTLVNLKVSVWSGAEHGQLH